MTDDRRVSIKDWVDAWAAANQKVWEHDRDGVLSASEVGCCLRKAFLGKTHPALANPDYVDDYGFKVRGDLIERHLWVPAIEHAVRQSNSLAFLYGGDAQRSVVAGFLGATPDGLLTGVNRSALAHLGVADIGESGEVIVEAKSIDPRAKLLEPKPEHVFQVQVQLGILREVTEHRPDYALISYIDASCHSLVREWPIRFDPAAYTAARTRARQVFAAKDAADLPPEGKLDGGKECRLCKFSSACGAIEAEAVPTDDRRDDLPPDVIGALAELVAQQAAWKREKKEAERNLALAQDAIRQTLRRAASRSAQGRGWAVSYARVSGRKTIDVKALAEAATAAGIDITRFERLGADADRLTIRTLGEGDGDGDDDE